MSFWAFVPVGLLGACLIGLGVMASIAGRDPGFALEPNYYEKAVNWDQEQAQRAENLRLGYRLDVSFDDGMVIVRGSDADGEPLVGAELRAEAFANARAADLRRLIFTERAPGRYEARLDARRSEVWEFRFDVQHAGHRFTHTTKVDVVKESGR